jgi:hypothetical protein
MLTGSTVAVLRLDGAHELGKGRRKPVSRIGIHTELGVASAKVLDAAVSSAEYSRCVQPTEAAHRPQSGFQSAVICFDRIVRVLLHDETGRDDQLSDVALINAVAQASWNASRGFRVTYLGLVSVRVWQSSRSAACTECE